MNDDNTNTIIKDEPAPPAPAQPAPFDCIKCGRHFGSAPALRMHKIRKHSSKNWDTGKNFQKKHQTREQRLATRRIYQNALRDRYYSEGRNSRGEKMPPGWKPRKHKGRKSTHIVLSRTPEYQRRYQARYQAKKKARNNQEAPLDAQLTSTTPDITGQAAKAIMVAASVIRAVTTGMKITNL